MFLRNRWVGCRQEPTYFIIADPGYEVTFINEENAPLDASYRFNRLVYPRAALFMNINRYW
jgi:hypothetical protein